MKKICIFLLLVLFAFAIPSQVKADDTPRVFLDGQELTFDVPPVIVDGRVLVPFKDIFEKMGYEFSWIPQDQAIMARHPGASTWLWMQLGNNKAYFGDKEFNMPVPPQTVDGRTMVPLGFVAEYASCKVNFNPQSNTVTITQGPRQIADIQGYLLFNPYTGEGIREMQIYKERLNANVNSPFIIIGINFTGVFNNALDFSWYHVKNGKRVLVYSEEQFIKTDKAYSKLLKDKYEVGDWLVELTKDGTVLGTYNFKIDNDSKGYRMEPWVNGSFEGYFYKDRPLCGYIKLVNGTEIYADWMLMVVYSGAGSEHVQLDPKHCPELSKITSISGKFYYPDGAKFEGNFLCDVHINEFEDGLYKVSYNIDGVMTFKDGASKLIKGSTETFDPNYQFDKMKLNSYEN